MQQPFPERGRLFREAYAYIRQVGGDRPAFENHFGSPHGGMDVLPKPTADRLPLLITGSSRQSPRWLAENGDGWITYPRSLAQQRRWLATCRSNDLSSGTPTKPAMQSLYIDLVADPRAPPKPIHLGFQSGTDYLLHYLQELQTMGMNHVAINVRFNQAPIDTTLQRLADDILPHFSREG